MVDYCVYLRVSTDKQGTTGLGMQAQRDAVARYVHGRGSIVGEFVEVENGRKVNRPQLRAALEECRKRRAVLLIARLDRLARNVAFIANLMNSDVEFVAVDMPQANRLTIHILAAVAEHEREMISQRTKAALAAAKARGVKVGNPRWREALVQARAALKYADPPAEVFELMRAWYVHGGSLRSIASRLNALNIRTPQGFHWYASTVRSALAKTQKDESAKELKGAFAQSLSNGTADRPCDVLANSRKDETAIGRNSESAQGCDDEGTTSRNHERALASVLPDDRRGFSSMRAPSSRGRTVIRKGADSMPSNVREAHCMLDLFTSVGARSFTVTKTDINQKLLWGKSYEAAELFEKLPAMVRTAEVRRSVRTADGKTMHAGENLIVRPTGPEVAFVQLDDLTSEQLDRVRPASFMILSTSPGNHQAWIAVSGIPKEKEPFKAFMRRVREAVGGTDKSASGAVRIAGVENWKEKYLPNPPVVSIAYAMPGRVMTAERLQQMGLLAEPALVKLPVTPAPARVSDDRPWPSYQITLSRTRAKKDGSGPDRSLADFNFALVCLTGQRSVEETIAKLLEVSERARERAAMGDEGYARVTVENAAAAVARNFNKGYSRA